MDVAHIDPRGNSIMFREVHGDLFDFPFWDVSYEGKHVASVSKSIFYGGYSIEWPSGGQTLVADREEVVAAIALRLPQ